MLALTALARTEPEETPDATGEGGPEAVRVPLKASMVLISLSQLRQLITQAKQLPAVLAQLREKLPPETVQEEGFLLVEGSKASVYLSKDKVGYDRALKSCFRMGTHLRMADTSELFDIMTDLFPVLG